MTRRDFANAYKVAGLAKQKFLFSLEKKGIFKRLLFSFFTAGKLQRVREGVGFDVLKTRAKITNDKKYPTFFRLHIYT